MEIILPPPPPANSSLDYYMDIKMLGTFFYKWKAVDDVQLSESFGRWAKISDVPKILG